MKSVVGEDSLSEEDKSYLVFLKKFETEFINQGKYECRTIFDSLALAWKLMRIFPRNQLKRINNKLLDEFFPRAAGMEFEDEEEGAGLAD